MPVTRDLLAYCRGSKITNDPLHYESVAVAVNCDISSPTMPARVVAFGFDQ